MADLSDVETVLSNLVVQALYPNGIEASGILNRPCRVYRGWPNAGALDEDLAAGIPNVSVFPESAQQVNTTRFPDTEIIPNPVQPSLAANVAGSTVTFSGDAGLGQLAGILADGLGVVHRTQSGDTASSVAARLATLLRLDRAAVLAGATVTVPGATKLIARVVADQQAFRETRRQRQGFRISCWCPDPLTRDASAGVIDAQLSTRDFIPLSDGTFGHLRFVSSSVFDQSQNASLYRRDLLYSVEYATTLQPILPSMIFGDQSVAANGAGAIASGLS